MMETLPTAFVIMRATPDQWRPLSEASGPCVRAAMTRRQRWRLCLLPQDRTRLRMVESRATKKLGVRLTNFEHNRLTTAPGRYRSRPNDQDRLCAWPAEYH